MDNIKELLEDVVSHHSALGNYLVLAIVVFVFVMFLRKRQALSHCIFINVCCLCIEVVNFANGARINEWTGIYDTTLFDKVVANGYLCIAIGVVIAVITLVEICIRFFVRKGSL